jgi:hypothetical protein
MASLNNAVQELCFIKRLPCFIFFYYKQRQLFHGFICGEAVLTGKTFAPAADACTFLRGAGIYYLALGITAFGAFHYVLPPYNLCWKSITF